MIKSASDYISMQMAEGKLTYQHTHTDHTNEPAKKKRREATRVEHVTTVAEHFKPADLSSVKQVSLGNDSIPLQFLT